MANRAHARRRSQGFIPAAVGGVAGACVALTLLPQPVGFATIADAAPIDHVTVELAPVPAPTATSPGAPAEVLPPAPPPPPVITGRPIAPLPSPCTVKTRQATATEADLRSAYRTPRAYELAEDAAIIATALHQQCGFTR